ncbi:MAG: hypothetical protein KF777_08670 [Planctomycetaceae bacterium]|nr:hypothetical protein [Planctomycetaceae bacterium]
MPLWGAVSMGAVGAAVAFFGGISAIIALLQGVPQGVLMNGTFAVVGVLFLTNALRSYRLPEVVPPELCGDDSAIGASAKPDDGREETIPARRARQTVAYVLFFCFVGAVAAFQVGWYFVSVREAERIAALQKSAIQKIEQAGGVATGIDVTPGHAPNPTIIRLGGGDSDPFYAMFHGQHQLREFQDADVELTVIFPTVENLTIISNEVTDAGLAFLKSHRDLRFLTIHCPRVTDTGLEVIADMPKLETLDLSGTQLTNTAVLGLDRKPRLEEFHLENTSVTDVGLSSLEKLDSLRFLFLKGTQVSREAVRALKPKIYFCEIMTD